MNDVILGAAVAALALIGWLVFRVFALKHEVSQLTGLLVFRSDELDTSRRIVRKLSTRVFDLERVLVKEKCAP